MDQSKIDALRAAPVPAFNHLIDGVHVPASDGRTMTVTSPIDGSVLTTVADGTEDDMTRAIASARSAPGILGMIHKEPVGVVGAIIPWNFPMMIGAWKLGPALAMGNSVVLKPSETASLSLMRMCDLALEAGLPPGVLNAVTGQGAVVGKALGLSMEVDVLVFTGSGATGRRLMEYAAQSNMKRVYLELGGKSPNIIFADAPDLDVAAQVAAGGIFRNAGQVCVAGARLLVEASVHDEVVAAVAKAANAMQVGDPLDTGTQIGAINSETQLAANLGFVETAASEGGTVITGGQRVLEHTGGTYMAPTIVTGVTGDATLAQKEVFGPVLAVTAFETEQEAIALANGTVYGLAGAAWTANLGRAHRMVRGVRTGVMHINTYGGLPLRRAGFRTCVEVIYKSVSYQKNRRAWRYGTCAECR